MLVTEKITINECPICHLVHVFELDVERSLSVGLTTPDSLAHMFDQKCFTRLFICPKDDKEFQVSFNLISGRNDRIERVTVKGAAQDEPAE